jgi:lactate dehydrogenase-like 2-hydroxyacid dehydrogenase
MKPKILIIPDTRNVPIDLSNSLKSHADVEYVQKPYDHKLAKAYAVIVGTEKIGVKYLDRAPKLRLVARFGVGYDSVDVEACTKRGIFVTHTPDVLSSGVADHTWALILAYNRQIPKADKYTRTKWAKREKYIPFGWDTEGKTLGILGLGRIGTEVVKRAKGFPVETIYYDVVRREELEKKFNIKYVSFEELLSRSDILTIHLSLQESTRGIIDKKAFESMKTSTLIVNTSRGPIIDEKALIEALQEGKIGGAALDVFDQEPTPLDNPLLKMNNVILTPHCASATWGTRRKMAERSIKSILEFLKGKRPPFVVPEQKKLEF